MMMVVVTTGAVRHTKLQSKLTINKPNTQFLYRPATNSVNALKGCELTDECVYIIVNIQSSMDLQRMLVVIAGS